MTIETLRPNAAGDECNISGEDGAACPNHYQNVDEVSHDGWTTNNHDFNAAPQPLSRDLYGCEDHTTETGVIDSVKVLAYVNRDTTTGYYRLSIRTNGVSYNSTENALNGASAWILISNTWSTNPQTGLAWTWAEVDAMEIGGTVQKKSSTSPAFTQIYAEVDYGEGAILVSKTHQSIWNVRTLINRPIQFKWNVAVILNLVSRTLMFQWNVRAFVSDTLRVVFSVRSLVNKTNQYIWNVRTLINKSLQTIFNVRMSVNDTFQSIWHVRELVNDTVNFKWDVYTLVGQTLQAIFNVRALISKTNQLKWNVRVLINKSLQVIWNVRKLIDKTIQFKWNVAFSPTLVSKTLELHWNVSVTLLAVLGTTTKITGLVDTVSFTRIEDTITFEVIP